MKYLKWVFGKKIANTDKEEFKIGEEVICNCWDPKNNDWDKRGGFNFTNEECALRWASRGDTLYEVTIPSDGELVEIKNQKTPGGIFIANKIILSNPILISEELLDDFYEKSKLPEETYYECIGLLASRNYYDLALKIIKDKVSLENIDLVIEKYNSAIKPWHNVDYDCYNRVKDILMEIKSPCDINLFISKDPYIKILTNDNVINVTGQSGSGKSTYIKNNYSDDKYIVIDTDDLFKENKLMNSYCTLLKNYLNEKYKEKQLSLANDFDLIYNEILLFFKDYDKTIIIDCAQFHCIKNIKLLKGKIIIIRTCIDTCYERTISRYITRNSNYTTEELEKYKQRKKSIYTWYKDTNKFIQDIDLL